MVKKNWREDPLEYTPPVLGSGEFLKDRGYADPTQTKIKFGLVAVIRDAVELKGLNQSQVADIVNHYDRNVSISQPDVSRILRGQVKGFSESRLMTILAALDYNVSIVVQHSSGKGQISVQESEMAVA